MEIITATGIQKAIRTVIKATTSPETVVSISGRKSQESSYIVIYVNDLFSIKAAVKAPLEKEFTFTTTASEISKVLAITGDVSFKVSDDEEIVPFTWGHNTLKIRKTEAKIPEMRRPEKDAKTFCIPTALIKMMCRDTLWVNEGNESFPNVRLKMEAAGGVGNLTVYAVDSKVVVKRTEQFATTNPDCSEVVDINAKHLKALMATIEDPSVDIVLSQGNLFLRTGSVVIDAKYTACENTVPDAERVLSTKNSRYSVSFDKADMLGKLRMSSTFTGNDRTARAVLTFLKDETRLEAVSETTKFADMQVLSEISDENACGLSATFSLNLLQDILKIYPDDTIKLDFTSSTQPFWLCAEDGDENEKSILTACFMPLKS